MPTGIAAASGFLRGRATADDDGVIGKRRSSDGRGRRASPDWPLLVDDLHGFPQGTERAWHLYARTMQKAVAVARLSDYTGALGQRCSLRLAV
ncbi:hypothetical protein ACWIEX_19920 [Bosea sp. NPDC055353]